METSKVTRPDTIKESTWEDNQRWVKLMAAQAEQHRSALDPRLYRKSSRKQLIKPVTADDT